MNQMALHTDSGCTQVNPVQSSTLINSTDCNYQANSNLGCVVTDPSTASYGARFASSEGGRLRHGIRRDRDIVSFDSSVLFRLLTYPP